MDIKEMIKKLRSTAKLEAYYTNDYNGLYNQAADTLENLQAENERLRVELEQTKRERDAAIRDLKLCAGFDDSLCHFCKTDSEKCSSCISGTRWQWREPQEE